MSSFIEFDRFLGSIHPEEEFRSRFYSPTCEFLEVWYRSVIENGEVRSDDGFTLFNGQVIARPALGRVTIPDFVSGLKKTIYLNQWFIIKNPNKIPIHHIGTYNGITEYCGYMLAGRVSREGTSMTIQRPIIQYLQQPLMDWYYEVFAKM